jgi:hypothetical protein
MLEVQGQLRMLFGRTGVLSVARDHGSERVRTESEASRWRYGIDARDYLLASLLYVFVSFVLNL